MALDYHNHKNMNFYKDLNSDGVASLRAGGDSIKDFTERSWKYKNCALQCNRLPTG